MYILVPSGGSSQSSDGVAERAEVLPRPIRPDDLRLYIVSDDEDEAPGPPVHLHPHFGIRLLFLRDWLCSALAACGAASVTSWRSTEKILSLWSWQLLHKRHGGTKLSRVIPLNLWPQLLHKEERWWELQASYCSYYHLFNNSMIILLTLFVFELFYFSLKQTEVRQ